jgi:hypothetical protein
MGFSLALSGMKRPEEVFCSASAGLTTIRSAKGLIILLFLFFADSRFRGILCLNLGPNWTIFVRPIISKRYAKPI